MARAAWPPCEMEYLGAKALNPGGLGAEPPFNRRGIPKYPCYF